jgi:DNA-binding transcriptional LysR family regulator
MQNLNRIPLTALRAAEAAGRLGTLGAAARELGLTVGAVSQRVQNAEAALGRPLFRRTARGLVATPLGAEVLPRLTRGMAELAAAVALADPARDACLTVSVAPIFASRWLVWRIARFQARSPGVRIRIEPSVALLDPDTDDVDLCIRVGTGPWPGVEAERLIDQRVFPVAAPELAARVKTPADLGRLPVIRETEALFGWDRWLAPQGLSPAVLGDGPTFADASLCLDAAMAGQGVFMAWETLACDALSAGRLVAPLPGRAETGKAYWLVSGSRRRVTPAVAAFRVWLKEELMASEAEWRAAG